jgi:hypothetical protein
VNSGSTLWSEQREAWLGTAPKYILDKQDCVNDETDIVPKNNEKKAVMDMNVVAATKAVEQKRKT